MYSDKEKISSFLEMEGIIGRKSKKGHKEISGCGEYAHSLDCADGLTNVYTCQISPNCVFYICAAHCMLIILCKAVKKCNHCLEGESLAWTMLNKKQWGKAVHRFRYCSVTNS